MGRVCRSSDSLASETTVQHGVSRIYLNMLSVTYGTARLSKSDHGVHLERAYSDVVRGRIMNRRGWRALLALVQTGSTRSGIRAG